MFEEELTKFGAF